MKIISGILAFFTAFSLHAEVGENLPMKSVEYIQEHIKPYEGKDIDVEKFRLRGDDENSVILEGMADRIPELSHCEFAIPLSFNSENKIFTAKENKGYILCPDVETYLEVKVSINDKEHPELNGVNSDTKKSIIVSLKQ